MSVDLHHFRSRAAALADRPVHFRSRAEVMAERSGLRHERRREDALADRSDRRKDGEAEGHLTVDGGDAGAGTDDEALPVVEVDVEADAAPGRFLDLVEKLARAVLAVLDGVPVDENPHDAAPYVAGRDASTSGPILTLIRLITGEAVSTVGVRTDTEWKTPSVPLVSVTVQVLLRSPSGEDLHHVRRRGDL
jgi:hypothetical protein